METAATYTGALRDASAADARAQSRRTGLIIAGLIGLAGALSLFFFMGQSLRLDEAQSLWQTSRSPAEILFIVGKDVHVPLYHELLHFWRLFVGDGVTGARLLSLLFYMASIPAMYFFGKLAYGRTVGTFAALLFAVSPFMNWYGNEIRMYMLFVLLTILNQYCFMRIFKSRDDPQQAGNAWFGYAVTAILGVYAHYFFFLNLLSQAMFYFLRRDLFPKEALRRFIVTAVLVAVAFLPWAYNVYMLGEAGNQHPLLQVPTSVNLFNAFSDFLIGFQNDHVNTFFLSLWPISLLFGFLALRGNRRMHPETQYLLITLFLSIALAFAISFITPVFVSRYLIFTVPSLYLLLLSLFSNYSPTAASAARWSLAGLMSAMLIVEIVNPTAPVKENYREAAEFLTQNAAAQDVIVLSAPFTVYPIEYYYRGAATIETVPAWERYEYGPIPPFSSAEMPADVTKITETHQRVWLLLSYDQGYEKEVQDYFDTHFQQLETKEFSHGLNLYVYQVRYDTPLAQTALR